ncbi:DUF3857 domain-containing protein [uncultured Acetobacteroides sp.]|uniref:DUF3857 domain-containing protein n=1 Tax=uncultured Acetobacteroides sp. TaxID=1760811 RepID=UPI0029F50DFF|nr:DUF3857 domain-containing protein [uncultured Acetobacteroides sp.]
MNVRLYLKPYVLLFFLLFISSNRANSQAFDAEVIKYNRTCRVETGRMSQIDTVTIQINNRNGEEYTHVAIPYSKDYKVSDIDAWIIDRNGSKVRSLKSNEITDRSAISDISLYEDDFVKEFQLRHSTYPYRIAYTYKTSCKSFIQVTNWTPIINTMVPTRSARLRVIAPKTIPLRKYAANIASCRVDSTKQEIVYEWSAAYPKILKEEAFAKPLDAFLPCVMVAPIQFYYGVEGSTRNWASYGDWQSNLLKGLDVLPEDERVNLAHLTQGITDRREIVRILYHYLQDNTRYINVSIGIGGMKPYPASYVAQNKYGDCKALSNYMRAMLKCVGIDSYYVLVMAGDQPHELIKDYVGPQFNHAIVAVPNGQDTIWVEATSKVNPLGYIGTFTQNREALLVCESNSRIVRVPAMKIGDNATSRRMKFDLQADGNARATISYSLRGRDFELFSSLDTELNANEQDRFIREYIPFSNYELEQWKLQKMHRDTARIELQASLSISKMLKPIANDFYIGLQPSRIPYFAPISKRCLPVEIPYPICNADTLVYTLPQGYRVTSNLDAVSMKSRFGSYELTFKYANGVLMVAKRLVLHSAAYRLEEYPDFYGFIQAVKEAEKRAIVLKPTA